MKINFIVVLINITQKEKMTFSFENFQVKHELKMWLLVANIKYRLFTNLLQEAKGISIYWFQ